MAVKSSSIPRRTFLKGSAGLAGAAALSGSPASALGILRQQPGWTLAYWNGERFVNPDRIEALPAMEEVRVTMSAYGKGPLAAIDLVAFPDGPDAVREAPFFAWTAPPNGPQVVSFVARVDPLNGLRFVVRCRSAGTQTEGSLTFGAPAGPRLKAGAYVLAPGAVDLGPYSMDREHPLGPLGRRLGTGPDSPAQYVVLRVAPL